MKPIERTQTGRAECLHIMKIMMRPKGWYIKNEKIRDVDTHN